MSDSPTPTCAAGAPTRLQALSDACDKVDPQPRVAARADPGRPTPGPGPVRPGHLDPAAPGKFPGHRRRRHGRDHRRTGRPTPERPAAGAAGARIPRGRGRRRRHRRRTASARPTEAAAKPEPEPKTLAEELLAELDALIGLADVKAEIHRQVAVLRVEGLRTKAGLRVADHHPAPGLRRQSRAPARRRWPGWSAASTARSGCSARASWSRSTAPSWWPATSGQTAIKTAEVVATRGRRRAVHRRGVQPGRRPVRHRGDRHPGQGDGGPARRPGADRGRLPGPDGRLHRAEPRAGQPVPHHDRVRRLHRRRAGRPSSPAGRRRRLRRRRTTPGPASATHPGRPPRADRCSATDGSPATCSRRRSVGTPGACATSTSPRSSSCASCCPRISTTTRPSRDSTPTTSRAAPIEPSRDAEPEPPDPDDASPTTPDQRPRRPRRRRDARPGPPRRHQPAAPPPPAAPAPRRRPRRRAGRPRPTPRPGTPRAQLRRLTTVVIVAGAGLRRSSAALTFLLLAYALHRAEADDRPADPGPADPDQPAAAPTPTATNAFLVGGLEPADQRAAYDDAIDRRRPADRRGRRGAAGRRGRARRR